MRSFPREIKAFSCSIYKREKFPWPAEFKSYPVYDFRNDLLLFPFTPLIFMIRTKFLLWCRKPSRCWGQLNIVTILYHVNSVFWTSSGVLLFRAHYKKKWHQNFRLRFTWNIMYYTRITYIFIIYLCIIYLNFYYLFNNIYLHINIINNLHY